MAREVVTRRTVLHHYCSTKIRFEPPTQSVTWLFVPSGYTATIVSIANS